MSLLTLVMLPSPISQRVVWEPCFTKWKLFCILRPVHALPKLCTCMTKCTQLQVMWGTHVRRSHCTCSMVCYIGKVVRTDVAWSVGRHHNSALGASYPTWLVCKHSATCVLLSNLYISSIPRQEAPTDVRETPNKPQHVPYLTWLVGVKSLILYPLIKPVHLQYTQTGSSHRC